MQARHVTSSSDYRVPFGAAQLGGTVLLSIDVWDDEPQAAELRLWFDDSETLIPMGRMDRSFDPEMGQMDRSFDPVRFTAEFEPPHPGVYWYSFRITADSSPRSGL